MQVAKVDVSYTEGGKAYSFSPNNLDLKVGDVVVVDTVRGNELGYVCSPIQIIEDYEYADQLKNVLRFATSKDIQTKKENIEKEKQIKEKTEEIATKLKLDMKITNAELNLERTKVVINFTSDNRVDFRELVKELASAFKIRIELKQIGSRVETQLLGGLGPCGRPVCCNLFLKDFEHSTIKMAKNQGLSLNPTKISGLCGKLMCCLAYENNHYAETLSQMPKVGSIVETKRGKGQVVYNNLLKKLVQVKFVINEDNFEIEEFELCEVKFDEENKDNNAK